MFTRIPLPLQLIIIMVAVFCCGNYVPTWLVELFYTISVVFKDLLSSLLPFMVFFFVSNGIISLQRGAPVVLLTMLGSIFVSNALVALTTYCIVSIILPSFSGTIDASLLVPSGVVNPLFSLSIKPLIRSEHALIAAIIGGLIFSRLRIPHITMGIARGKKLVEFILVNCFIPLLPLYVLGFLLKIQHEGLLVKLVQYYSGAFLLIVGLQFCMLLIAYFLATGFSVRRMATAMANTLPSYLTAFSTMSSTATVPVSIAAANKNIKNPALVDVAMPIMANVHLLGDAVGTPVLALTTMHIFMGIVPTFAQYLLFVSYFCTSMFAVSGVPGGGIIVIIPILVSLFGFTPEMVSVVTTLYFLMDPFGTGTNVMGDGALVIIVNKILRFFNVAHQED